MADETVIRVENVSKNFILPHERAGSVKSIFTSLAKGLRSKETQHALKDVSFEVKKGEFFGIVGRNGSGKSTLLKILAGIYQPTEGRVGVRGKLVPFIELGVGFNPELTGRENVYLNGALLGFSKKEVAAMYDDIVKFAELERFMDQKLKNYSSGMQVRLAFSMAVRAEADILLIDEVLAVGDADFQRKCFEYFKKLKKNNKTVIFVSHDMGAVREFCDRAVLIDRSEIQAIGSTADITAKYGQMFVDEGPTEDFLRDEKGKRWGNGKIEIKSVKATLDRDQVVIKATAKVNHKLDSVMYGLHINAQDGSEITAMNNRMILKPDISDLKSGDTVSFTWNLMNVFNDGKYFVTLTFVNEAGIAYDWFSDAATFKVKRPQRSTTPVLPPVSVTYKIS